MRIIALMNQKGGVGKTTTAVNLAAAIAEAGRSVCLIDLDPQSHLTINCGLDPSAEGASLYDVLVEDRTITSAMRPVGKGMSLVPASIDLAGAEVELVSAANRQTILKRRIDAAVAAGELNAEFIILDCPPSLGLLTLNALAAAGEVIIPMQPHFLALQGVGKLLETVAMVNSRLNPSLKVSGIVLTMFDSQTRLSGEVVKDLNDFLAAGATQKRPWSGAVIFQTRIRRNVKLAESPGFGKTILQYDTASHGAADYRALAQEVIALQPVLGNTAGIAVPAPLRPAVERAVLPATNAVA